MDNYDTPFHAPVNVAVSLNDLQDAALDGLITSHQAQQLWTRWVEAPARLGESTYPMSLPMMGISADNAHAAGTAGRQRGVWPRALGFVRKLLRTLAGR